MDFLIEKILMPLCAILMIIVLTMLLLLPFSIQAGNICLKNGYPNGYIVFPYEIKCGRIVNQTEYICSLDDVLANSCLQFEFSN